MWFGILAFIIGVYVGYKYPQQVHQTLETGKKTFNDLKNKILKKDQPPQG